MITLAFVAGVLPLLISSGVGSGDIRAIGSVIAGGQRIWITLQGGQVRSPRQGENSGLGPWAQQNRPA